MNSFKYIGFYPKDTHGYSRNGSIAAANKMDYICGSIIGMGKKVEIISPAWFTNMRKMSKQSTIHESEYKTITQAPSYFASNRISRRILSVISRLWLFYYILKSVKKGENVFVYHSLMLIIPVLMAKKIIKFNLVLEVNEIYCDVKQYSQMINRLEQKMFSSADKYIFSTELLNEKLNKTNKPYTINHGTYKFEKDRNCKFNDGKIHAVYAGIIDEQKGSLTAVSAAEHLNGNYHIHIIGFGSEKDVKNLNDKITEVTLKTECTVTYDGLLQGEDYIQFLQKCDVGLSTQKATATFNETSFPSKVLSYLSNGLRVVSVKMNAIENSKIGGLIFFYDDDSPKGVANAIMNIDYSKPYDSRKELLDLDLSFSLETQKMLGI